MPSFSCVIPLSLSIGGAILIHYAFRRKTSLEENRQIASCVAESDSELHERFKQASEAVASAAFSLDNDMKLNLYALYKQATVGKCAVPAPSRLDVVARSKWKSWVELGDMSFDAAKSEYVSLVRTLDSTSLSNEFAPRQSTLMNSTSSEDWEIVSNAFHFASIGDIDQVDQLLSSSAHCIDSQDDQGRALLHWAVDREQRDMVLFLLERGADIELRDEDGSTPLAYAISCEHISLIKDLVEAGADVYAADTDGETPYSLATAEVKEYLNEIKLVKP